MVSSKPESREFRGKMVEQEAGFWTRSAVKLERMTGNVPPGRCGIRALSLTVKAMALCSEGRNGQSLQGVCRGRREERERDKQGRPEWTWTWWTAAHFKAKKEKKKKSREDSKRGQGQRKKDDKQVPRLVDDRTFPFSPVRRR
ncbi:hypothetical protein TESG_08606 [Trichophyton tonsurans CBS 112818]|uniref:Uncharacterized protein n=2 Tax=Trichophyton TaxID=5550 RepID=F2Q0T6_TRIEC|nr:hypothetical protein TESG_08606 [Trichophyton tonsurans CBS 112818]EGE07754.1 hypothetical protein TEQG_06786 [Trichophyton equinum CBS 127.97]